MVAGVIAKEKEREREKQVDKKRKSAYQRELCRGGGMGHKRCRRAIGEWKAERKREPKAEKKRKKEREQERRRAREKERERESVTARELRQSIRLPGLKELEPGFVE